MYLINYIFNGGPAPVSLAAGDANCTGTITISDAVYLIQFIFAGGPAPCLYIPRKQSTSCDHVLDLPRTNSEGPDSCIFSESYPYITQIIDQNVYIAIPGSGRCNQELIDSPPHCHYSASKLSG